MGRGRGMGMRVCLLGGASEGRASELQGAQEGASEGPVQGQGLGLLASEFASLSFSLRIIFILHVTKTY